MDECCICHKHCMGHTNVAIPFRVGLCCDKCYKIYVIPAKVKNAEMKEINNAQ